MKKYLCNITAASLIGLSVVSSVKAQTNTTAIVDGGYYRMYVPAVSLVLYNNSGYLQKTQATAGDNSDVFQLNVSGSAYTIKSMSDGRYLGDFVSSKFAGQTKNWLQLSDTPQEWQVIHHAASANYSLAWAIGKVGIAMTDEGLMNYNSKGAVLSWKILNADAEDVNSYFWMCPLTRYTLGTITGSVAGMTLSATDSKGYKSSCALVSGNSLYFDAEQLLDKDKLSINDNTFVANYSVNGTTIDVALQPVTDKLSVINAHGGDATSLVASADCSDIAGWTNAQVKSGQTNPYGATTAVFEVQATDMVSQTLTGMPAGKYTLLAAVRGGSKGGHAVRVALGGESTSIVLKDGDKENATGSPWTDWSLADDASSDKVTGAYRGWIQANVSTTLDEEGDLTLSFEPTTSNWTQIYDIHLLYEAPTTSLEMVKSGKQEDDIYTLDGKRLPSGISKKGIYIINRKVVVRK